MKFDSPFVGCVFFVLILILIARWCNGPTAVEREAERNQFRGHLELRTGFEIFLDWFCCMPRRR